MVALVAAHGFAQACGRPAAVFVHVDVGTQALAGAVHNADRGRIPVLIYAGASPFMMNGESRGSENECFMSLQNVHDQPAIVRQYMRFTRQINSSKDVGIAIWRWLQIATSEPRGPVYLWAGREVREEVVDEDFAKTPVNLRTWMPMESQGLNQNPKAVRKFVELSERLSIPVLVACPTTVNFPHGHPDFVGLTFGVEPSRWLREADTVLIIDSGDPYIPMHNKPKSDARVFHIDVNVMKDNIGMFHVDAQIRCKADAETALSRILECIPDAIPSNDRILTRAEKVRTLSLQRIANLESVRSAMPSDGWGLGDAIGASLSRNDLDLVVLVIGDGPFLFDVPASAFWIARKYCMPFLTIILNNGVWKLELSGLHVC
ncbi:hypothetical protein ACEPAH_8780 [Sanghuangporus vaninii]